MRPISLAIAASLCLVVAACAGTKSTSEPRLAADCSDMVNASTWLSADLLQWMVARRCERRQDMAGHQATVYVATGPLVRTVTMSADNMPWSDAAPQIAVFITRFDGPVIPSDDQTGLQQDYVVHKLGDQISAKIGGRVVDADVLRVKDKQTRLTLGCLTVVVPGKTGTPTQIVICRSNGEEMTDDLVLQQARAIAIHDFPAINP